MTDRAPRPLDRVGSIKVKLGLVVVGTVTVTVLAILAAVVAGVRIRFAVAGGLVLSLAVIQLLAHGMVQPLREMAAASEAMAAGDYARRVTATALDEVGAAARAFNAMAQRLDDADRQRRELVADVSHELRTPLAALQARLENVADGVEVLDAQGAEALLASVGRLSRLVSQVLRLAELDAGDVVLHREPLDVAEVAAEACAEVGALHPEVPLDMGAPEGLVVDADPDAMHQVLVNLLTNAAGHSPPGGTVRLRAERRPPSAVRIRVLDDGPGIPEAERERVFDRFHRVDAARSHRPGAGLGLAIARSLVHAHGGAIAVGTPDHGAELVVDLPAHR